MGAVLLGDRNPRPAWVEHAGACADEVAAVLAAHGHQAGQYHVLGPDPWQVLWNAGRTGFAAFLEEKHCVFAWRAPVAAPDQRAELVEALVAHARSRRKPLVVALVDESTCRAGQALGLSPIWMGSETYHELVTWSLSGGRRQKLRWARSHAVKLGCTWREVFPLEDPEMWAALEYVEQAWKAARAQRRTDSFQRTSFAELTAIRRYFVCEQPDEEGHTSVVASVACTPMNARDWYLQDPVRLPGAPRGALEGAIVRAMDALRDDGYGWATSGPLPFWRPDGHPDDVHALGPIGRRVIDFFDRQYRFKGLAQFRTKLEPDRVEPCYMLLSRRVVTPGMARSLVRVLTKRIG